jgi:hypothetical protein
MRERFGNPNYYDRYDMEDYTLRRDPMVFKYHRSGLKNIGKDKYEHINDRHNDYIYPQPVSLEDQLDGEKVVRMKHKYI